MKKFLLFCFLCSCIVIGGFFYFSKEMPQPLSQGAFDASIGITSLGREFVVEGPLDQAIYNCATTLIEKRATEQEQKKVSFNPIPKKIHQIWTERESLPDDLERGVASVQLHNGDCFHTLWTPEQYEPLLLSVYGTKDIPKGLERDMVAAAILIEHGGIVVDLEEECVGSFFPLLSLGDCVVGFEPPRKKDLFGRKLYLSSSVIASSPSHPLIKAWAHEMYTRSVEGLHKQFMIWATQESLTAVFAAKAIEEGHALFVGPTYFCPITSDNRKEFLNTIDGIKHRGFIQKTAGTLHLISPEPYSKIACETICIHMKGGRQAD